LWARDEDELGVFAVEAGQARRSLRALSPCVTLRAGLAILTARDEERCVFAVFQDKANSRALRPSGTCRPFGARCTGCARGANDDEVLGVVAIEPWNAGRALSTGGTGRPCRPILTWRSLRPWHEQELRILAWLTRRSGRAL
jgi:hypothetical protein